MSVLSEKSTIKKTSMVMGILVKDDPLKPPSAGDLVDGVLIKKDGTSVFIDIKPFGTGIIYGREFINARELIKSLNPDDTVTSKVTCVENEEGYIELSLKEAGQEILWKEAIKAKDNQEVFSLAVLGANKGGIIFDWKSIQGFLPASQLKTSHYPRVEGGDKDKILDELKKLVGEKLDVIIIDANQKEEKLIFSEKETEAEKIKNIMSKYKIGDVVEGEITGVVDFGVFVKIEEDLEGLSHISELDWSLVENPANLFAIGDKVNAQIIDIKNEKISLSIKALKFNPWDGAKEKYKEGDQVDGVVIKFNKYGTLVSIEEGVAGLVHISEFESEEAMHEALELGKSYSFKIMLFNPTEQKLILSFVK